MKILTAADCHKVFFSRRSPTVLINLPVAREQGQNGSG
jgi:hypothetical protein